MSFQHILRSMELNSQIEFDLSTALAALNFLHQEIKLLSDERDKSGQDLIKESGGVVPMPYRGILLQDIQNHMLNLDAKLQAAYNSIQILNCRIREYECIRTRVPQQLVYFGGGSSEAANVYNEAIAAQQRGEYIRSSAPEDGNVCIEEASERSSTSSGYNSTRSSTPSGYNSKRSSPDPSSSSDEVPVLYLGGPLPYFSLRESATPTPMYDLYKTMNEQSL